MWAGIEVFRAGDRLVGVEYDSAATREALRTRCRNWLPGDEATDPGAVPAAFGVRVAKVGFRRRKVGIVHHGAPVRYRLDDPATAIDVIARMLADVALDRPSSAISVDTRCVLRDGRAALLDVPMSYDVDERLLRGAGIVEVPAWRPIVDASAMTVDVGGERWPLAGLASVGPPMIDGGVLRRQLWGLGSGDVLAWAELLEDLDDERLVRTDDVVDACERALS